MGWRVALTDKAEGDLEAIVTFLARFSPEAAERIGLDGARQREDGVVKRSATARSEYGG